MALALCHTVHVHRHDESNSNGNIADRENNFNSSGEQAKNGGFNSSGEHATNGGFSNSNGGHANEKSALDASGDHHTQGGGDAASMEDAYADLDYQASSPDEKALVEAARG